MFPEPKADARSPVFNENEFPIHRLGELKESMARVHGGRPTRPRDALEVARGVLGDGTSGKVLCWATLALLDLEELYRLLENPDVEDVAIQHRRYVYVYTAGRWVPAGEIREPDRFWGGLRRTCEAAGIRTPNDIKPATEGAFALDLPDPIGFVTVRISWSEPPIVPSSCLTIRLARPGRAPDLQQLVKTGVLSPRHGITSRR